jgi:hypothetical protein
MIQALLLGCGEGTHGGAKCLHYEQEGKREGRKAQSVALP